MKIYLYSFSKPDAFRIARNVLAMSGFEIHFDDERRNLLSGSRITNGSNLLFFDVKICKDRHALIVSVLSNIFSADAGMFIAERDSEEQFFENFWELLRLQTPPNPFRLTRADYALATAC